MESQAPGVNRQAPPFGEPCRTIAAGDIFPDGKILYRNVLVNIHDFFKEKTTIVLGVLVCSEIHVQGFIDHLKEFKKRGLKDIICVSVSDPHVVKAWKESLHIVEDDIIFLCDTSGALCHKLGLLEDYCAEGLGYRCRRSAIIVGPNAVVQWVGLDVGAYALSVLGAYDDLSDIQRAAADKVQKQCDPWQRRDSDECAFVEEIEQHIRGKPHEGVDRPLEMKRSRCDVLYSDEDSTAGDAEDDSVSDTSEQPVAENAPFCHTLLVDSSKCLGRTLHDVAAKPGDEKMDIKFGYECPPRVYIRRDKSKQETMLWDITVGIMMREGAIEDTQIAAEAKSFGYVVVDGHRYYARQIHFHSPAVHVSTSGLDGQPVEMHIVHTRKGDQSIVMLCFNFVWEPEHDEAPSSVFMDSFIGAAHMQDFRSDGTWNTVAGNVFPFDLQGMIALNTMAAFYRYSIPLSMMRGFVRDLHKGVAPKDSASSTDRFLAPPSSTPEDDDQVHWIVARNIIPLSWKHFDSLHLLIGTSSVIEDPACTLSRSVSRLLVDSNSATGVAAARARATATKFAKRGGEDAFKRSSTLRPNQTALSPTASPLGLKVLTHTALASAPVALIVSTLLH